MPHERWVQAGCHKPASYAVDWWPLQEHMKVVNRPPRSVVPRSGLLNSLPAWQAPHHLHHCQRDGPGGPVHRGAASTGAPGAALCHLMGEERRLQGNCMVQGRLTSCSERTAHAPGACKCIPLKVLLAGAVAQAEDDMCEDTASPSPHHAASTRYAQLQESMHVGSGMGGRAHVVHTHRTRYIDNAPKTAGTHLPPLLTMQHLGRVSLLLGCVH